LCADSARVGLLFALCLFIRQHCEDGGGLAPFANAELRWALYAKLLRLAFYVIDATVRGLDTLAVPIVVLFAALIAWGALFSSAAITAMRENFFEKRERLCFGKAELVFVAIFSFGLFLPRNTLNSIFHFFQYFCNAVLYFCVMTLLACFQYIVSL
jgi:hypothetical protein